MSENEGLKVASAYNGEIKEILTLRVDENLTLEEVYSNCSKLSSRNSFDHVELLQKNYRSIYVNKNVRVGEIKSLNCLAAIYIQKYTIPMKRKIDDIDEENSYAEICNRVKRLKIEEQRCCLDKANPSSPILDDFDPNNVSRERVTHRNENHTSYQTESIKIAKDPCKEEASESSSDVENSEKEEVEEKNENESDEVNSFEGRNMNEVKNRNKMLNNKKKKMKKRDENSGYNNKKNRYLEKEKEKKDDKIKRFENPPSPPPFPSPSFVEENDVKCVKEEEKEKEEKKEKEIDVTNTNTLPGNDVCNIVHAYPLIETNDEDIFNEEEEDNLPDDGTYSEIVYDNYIGGGDNNNNYSNNSIESDINSFLTPQNGNEEENGE